VNPNGLDIFMHNSAGPFTGPGLDPALVSAPVALAAGADPSLTFALFAEAGNDSLTVIDHTLGDDPGPARIAATAVTVPLDDAVGLITLLDGRLVAFDRTTRKIVELQPVVTRSLPLGVPTLVSVGTGFTSAAFPALDVRDLAQAPSGALYALTVSGGSSSLLPLTPVDFDTDGTLEAGDGLPSGEAAIPLPSAGPYDAFEFLTETTALALQREDDAIDEIDLSSLTAQRVVSDLAGFGGLGPGDPSPARAIVVAHMELDVGVDVIDNQPGRSEFLIDPLSVLPPSTWFDLMQRPNLSSLAGISEANADPAAPLYVLGARRLISIRTADPANTRADCGVPDPEHRVHDVLQEEFVDQTLQDPEPSSLSPLADWGGPVPGAQTSGRLTAVAGQAGGVQLGDFRPQPFPGFNVDDGYAESAAAVNQAGWRIIFLDTDVQHFPLADGSTPGVTSNITVIGGKFNFHDVIIPEGVWIMARGSKPLQISATGKVEIAGLIDAAGSNGLEDTTFDTGFLPVPGGQGGPGGGRGGDAQPTLWNPKFAALIQINNGQQAAQYVTPERAEDGLGPQIGPTGLVSFGFVGGRGGLSTLGYKPHRPGLPDPQQRGWQHRVQPASGRRGRQLLPERRAGAHRQRGLPRAEQQHLAALHEVRLPGLDPRRDLRQRGDQAVAVAVPGPQSAVRLHAGHALESRALPAGRRRGRPGVQGRRPVQRLHRAGGRGAGPHRRPGRRRRRHARRQLQRQHLGLQPHRGPVLALQPALPGAELQQHLLAALAVRRQGWRRRRRRRRRADPRLRRHPAHADGAHRRERRRRQGRRDHWQQQLCRRRRRRQRRRDRAAERRRHPSSRPTRTTSRRASWTRTSRRARRSTSRAASVSMPSRIRATPPRTTSPSTRPRAATAAAAGSA
jgi:hypothetical protein